MIHNSFNFWIIVTKQCIAHGDIIPTLEWSFLMRQESKNCKLGFLVSSPGRLQ